MAVPHGIARNQRMMAIKIALAKRIASTPAVSLVTRNLDCLIAFFTIVADWYVMADMLYSFVCM